MSDPSFHGETDTATTAEPTAQRPSGVGGGWLTPRKIMVGMLATVVAVVVGTGLLVKVDYVALLPGSARDTEPLVVVVGTETYPSDGEVLFTTVRFRSKLNLIQYLWLKLDDEVEILPAETVLGDQTPEENRAANLELMTDSKEIAISVALERLGYDAISSDGVVVADVVPDSAAGGFLELGDSIVAVNGRPMPTALDLIEFLQERPPGVELAFDVERADGSAESVTVTMGARDDDPSVAFLGIVPFDRVSLNDERPFEVDIESGRVGGPSAGLAFTLTVLDYLTPGELTGGGEVAVTGTMAFDGRVGSVGGVPQKVAAVRDQGIDHFIVPEALGEEELALLDEIAGDQLEILPVRTLDEALEVLAGLGGDVGAVDEFAAQH